MRFESKLAAFAVHIALAKADECVIHATQVTTPVPPPLSEGPETYREEHTFEERGPTLRIDGQDVATVYTIEVLHEMKTPSNHPARTPIAEEDLIYFETKTVTRLQISDSFTLGAGQTLRFYSCGLSRLHEEYDCALGVFDNTTDQANYRLPLDYFSTGGDDPFATHVPYDKFQEVYNAHPNLDFAMNLSDFNWSFFNYLDLYERVRTTTDDLLNWIPYEDFPLEFYPWCNHSLSEVDRVLGIVLDEGEGGAKYTVLGGPDPLYFERIREWCSWTTETKTFYTSTCTDSIPDNSYYLKVQLSMTLFNITILWYCFVYGYLFPKDLKTIDPPEEEPQCDETPSADGCRDILDDFEEPVIIIDF